MSPSDQSTADHGRRFEQLRAAMAADRLDALAVTDLVSLRWLTGFTGSNAAAVVTDDALVVVTDGRYELQLAAELAKAGLEAEVVIDRLGDQVVGRRIDGLGRVGLEADRITWSRQRTLAELVGDRTDLVPLTGYVAGLRAVKDAWERSTLMRAAALADDALAAVSPLLRSGLTEKEVALRLDDHMVTSGADGPSFATIVASGPNSARPHHRPTDRVLTSGDLVIIDMGARVDGYGSDMTRTFFVGPVDDRRRAMYDAVIDSQAAGVEAVRAGASIKAVDDACRASLRSVGMEEAFKHGTGHGLGLEIHEEPFISARSTGDLVADQVVTVEPGVYFDGVGGVRIEDTVVVTADGCLSITRSPKRPEVAAG